MRAARCSPVEVVIVEDSRVAARSLIEHGDTDGRELWLLYFANGGNLMEWEFQAFLHGLIESSHLDLDLLALAVEEAHARISNRRR